MPSATHYDPNSPSEQPVILPSAPLIYVSNTGVLQPPLSRRGTGPGIILFLPASESLNTKNTSARPLDPEPVQKWAEEGFAVVGVTPSSLMLSIEELLGKSIEALLSLQELDTRDKFGVIVYDAKLLSSTITALSVDPRIACLIAYNPTATNSPTIPTLFHLISGPKNNDLPHSVTTHTYPVSSPLFILPQVLEYDPGCAALAHSRSLVFLRRWLGGPVFDLEAIWDEHTYFEFEDRSVAKTMGTMVAEPYVNHVPTMTGGIGRKQLTAFYRDHFIFSNPTDAAMRVISRTIGPDRIVDEFIYTFTHNRTVDWLLPAVPPSGKKMAIPMIAIVNIRGDRLYNEHIWWDQGTALRQAGILPTYLSYPTPEGNKTARLPVAGAECAEMLVDEVNGKSNEMLEGGWGLL